LFFFKCYQKLYNSICRRNYRGYTTFDNIWKKKRNICFGMDMFKEWMKKKILKEF
jgi:hypothetical protein